MPGHKGNSTTSQKSTQRPRNGNNPKTEPISSTSGIRNFFRNQQSMQNIHNESFSSASSFNSVGDDTMIDAVLELPLMVSVLEARRESLEERKNEISKIKDEHIKKILLDVMNDMRNVVEDSDKILRCHNELINRNNENTDEIQSNSKSINNLTSGVGNLADGINEMKNRIQSLEVSKNCSLDSHFINLVFVNPNDADCMENGTTGPKQKFAEILSGMRIVPPKEIIDAHLMTVRRLVNGRRKQTKILRSRFNDSLTAGRIFSQIIKHNKHLSDSGKQDEIKFYAEMPASKNVWYLKKICYELKNEGTLINVRGSDRGILVTFKVKDQHDETKEIVRTSTVTCVKEIDDLRKLLNAGDAYISVAEKYNDNYWNMKRKPENTQKRGRENDENDIDNDPKRPSSITPKQ